MNLDYDSFREFADSWALLALFIFFIGTWFWAFRPGSRKMHDDAANMVFRNEDAPIVDDEDGQAQKSEPHSPEGRS